MRIFLPVESAVFEFAGAAGLHADHAQTAKIAKKIIAFDLIIKIGSIAPQYIRATDSVNKMLRGRSDLLLPFVLCESFESISADDGYRNYRQDARNRTNDKEIRISRVVQIQLRQPRTNKRH